MARPVKEFRVKINGKSLQVYHKGEFVGSISFHKLCQLINPDYDIGTVTVTARPEFIKESDKGVG